MTWLNGGAGPLFGFLTPIYVEKEWVDKAFALTDAVQQVKEEKWNLRVADAAIKTIAARVANKTNTFLFRVQKYRLPMIKLSLLIKISPLNQPGISGTNRPRAVCFPLQFTVLMQCKGAERY